MQTERSTAIYLAARYSRREELQGYAKEAEAAGHTITSRWLKGEHLMTDEQLAAYEPDVMDLAYRYAQEDIEDLLAAELCIFFNEKPRATNSRGGRHVEFGIAIQAEKEIWIVGPLENVFHVRRACGVFDTWAEALGVLE